MAVGASQPTVAGTKDGRIGRKNQMQVTYSKALLNLYHKLKLTRKSNSCNMQLFTGKCYR